MTLSVYAVADGSDVAENLLTPLAPQPALPEGLRYPELLYYGEGGVEFNGQLNGELVWNDGLSVTERNTILTAFGVSDSVASNDVTVNIKLNTDSWLRVNCKAVYTQTDRRRPYGRENLRIQLNNLEAAS